MSSSYWTYSASFLSLLFFLFRSLDLVVLLIESTRNDHWKAHVALALARDPILLFFISDSLPPPLFLSTVITFLHSHVSLNAVLSLIHTIQPDDLSLPFFPFLSSILFMPPLLSIRQTEQSRDWVLDDTLDGLVGFPLSHSPQMVNVTYKDLMSRI